MILKYAPFAVALTVNLIITERWIEAMYFIIPANMHYWGIVNAAVVIPYICVSLLVAMYGIFVLAFNAERRLSR